MASNIVTSREIDDAILSYHYRGEGSINREGLISHRNNYQGNSFDVVEDFLSWFHPCMYGMSLSVSSYEEALSLCGYEIREGGISLSSLVSRKRETWLSDFLSHCESAVHFRKVHMVDVFGDSLSLSRVRTLLKKNRRWDLLIGIGRLYSVAALRKCMKCTMTEVGNRIPSVEKKLSDVWERDIEEMLSEIESCSFENMDDLVVHLNDLGFCSSTGKVLTRGTLIGLFRKVGFDYKGLKKDNGVIPSDTLSWYEDVYAKWREAIEEAHCLGVGQVMDYWEEIGFKTARGNSWSRWGLSLIQQRVSHWDWDFPVVEDRLINQVLSVWEDGKYKTIQELADVLGESVYRISQVLSDLGLEISYQDSSEYRIWVSEVVAYLRSNILFSGTGLSRIANILNEGGVPSSISENGSWYASTAQRFFEVNDIDRFGMYREVFKGSYPDWVAEIEEGSSIVDFLNELGIYPPKVRGRYVKWNQDRLINYLGGIL